MRSFRRSSTFGVFAMVACSTWLRAQEAGTPKVAFNEAEFRDKVYACWLGKNVGGTLGMPTEGARETHDFTFYTPVPKEPAANDDLDLQILWLKALQERGPRMNARILGEYWLKYVPVDWNEYGNGKRNMRDGIWPPLSGHFRNRQWRDSNGAWIRSEIWACLAPGCPSLAAKYAYEDACVDHGASEGTYAELFTATVESAAFVESDRDKLIGIGLSWIPKESALAKSINTAIESHKKGLDWKAARAAVVEASRSTGWFQAPQNVAFVVLGWLYGEGDFGKAICTAVNCGDDTDCTGATLGSIWGIIHGTQGIPRKWREPVGEGIKCVAIAGFNHPTTIGEFTDQTVAMAKTILKENNAPVAIRAEGRTDLSGKDRLTLTDPAYAQGLWARSPFRIPYEFGGVRATLDYIEEPNVAVDTPRPIKLLIENLCGQPRDLTVSWFVAPGASIEPNVIAARLPAPAAEPFVCEATLTVRQYSDRFLHGSVEIRRGDVVVGSIPLAFTGPLAVGKDDMALASKGAKATSDSELEREPGCTAKATDGIIAEPDDFDGKRWHAALTPHPHWIAVELPEVKEIGRVILHFADPSGHPVDFEGQVSEDGQTWTPVFKEAGYKDTRRFEKGFAPVKAKHFKLVIAKSSSSQYPHAAQISELELLPK